MASGLPQRIVARRVLSRFFFGGVFEAPPAMLEEIGTWLEAVHGAQRKKGLEKELERYQARLDRDAWGSTREELDKVREKPRAWGPYKYFAEHMWQYNQFLHDVEEGEELEPFQPLDYRTFRSLPKDEKIKETERLVKWMDEFIQAQEEKTRRQNEQYIQQTKDKISKIKVPEGISAQDTTKTFKVNLDGWKYETPEIIERAKKKRLKGLEEHRKEWVEDIRSLYEDEGKELPQTQLDFIQERIDKTKKKFEEMDSLISPRLKEITVSLNAEEPGKRGANGFWNIGTKELVISPHVDDLRRILRHELQHVGQTVIQYAFGHDPHMEDYLGTPRPSGFGYPSKRIQDPSIKQDNRKRKVPTREDLEHDRRLRERGIYPADMHALDDFEFYTRLADAIYWFRKSQEEGDWNADETRVALQFFTGAQTSPSDKHKWDDEKYEAEWARVDPRGRIRKVTHGKPNTSFKTWKKHNPGKWKHAAKELLKAVTRPSKGAEGSIQKLWEQFLDEKYEGGKAKVTNPNPKTRDSHPEITVSYLIKRSEPPYQPGRRRIRREFAAWRKQRQGPQQQQAPAPQVEPEKKEAPKAEKPKAKKPKRKKKAPPRVTKPKKKPEPEKAKPAPAPKPKPRKKAPKPKPEKAKKPAPAPKPKGKLDFDLFAPIPE